MGILRLVGEPFPDCDEHRHELTQVGEFSFVVLALAVNYQLLDNEISTMLVMVAVLSMTIAPWLVRHSVDIAKWVLGIRQANMWMKLCHS